MPFVRDATTVPAEIWDIIIDVLKDDKQTLARCASVHRTWRPRALGHLFRVIQLNSPENARRFLDILCGDGSIAHMVRGVELWEFESTWVQSPPELWNLAALCTSVQELRLVGSGRALEGDQYQSSFNAPVGDLFPLVEAAEMECMHLWSVDTLRGVLSERGRLKTLTLTNTQFCRLPWLELAEAPARFASITHLDIGKLSMGEGQWIEEAHALAAQIHHALPALTALRVWAYGFTDDMILGKLAGLLGPQLHDLELNINLLYYELDDACAADRLDFMARSFDLSRNTGLRRLAITGLPVGKGAGAETWVATLFAPLAAPALATLELQAWLIESVLEPVPGMALPEYTGDPDGDGGCGHVRRGYPLQLDRVDWPAVDRVVSAACPALRTLVFALEGACDPKDAARFTPGWLAAEMAPRLPRLLQSAAARFQVDLTPDDIARLGIESCELCQSLYCLD